MRTIDIIQKFTSDRRENTPTKFIVGARSKRAWHAWLAASVDKRIVSVVSIVFDLFNINQV